MTGPAYPRWTGSEPCQQIGSEWYFPSDDDLAPGRRNRQRDSVVTVLARACQHCPLLVECREWAVAHEEYGFWGGLTAEQRKRERVLRGVRLSSPPYWEFLPELRTGVFDDSTEVA